MQPIFNAEKIKQKAMRKYPFFASSMAGVETIITDKIPTAATDNEHLYFNPNFMAQYSEDEQVFVYAHEIAHIAFDHILRSEGKDKNVWNIATDAVINQLLKRDGLPMIKGGVDMIEGLTHNAEQLYEKLMAEKEQQKQDEQNQQQQKDQSQDGQQSQQSQSQGGNQNQDGQQDNQQSQSQQSRDNQNQQQGGQPGQSGDNSESQDNQQNTQGSGSGQSQEEDQEPFENAGHDQHDLWEKAVQKNKEKKQAEQEAKTKSGDNGDSEQEEQKEKKQKELSEMGEQEAFKENKDERKRQLEELMDALSKEASGAGNSTNSEKLKIADIGTGKQLIDWRYLLREAAQLDVDWSYRNAEIEDGVVSARLEEYSVPESEILLDTSGSISHTLLRNFLRECKHILANSRVKVGCFDTQFYGWTEIRDEKEIDGLPFQGGGGTNFTTAVRAFSQRVENKIIFTDGDANMPKEVIDAIWVVFGEIKINPPGGRVIQINKQQLERLMRLYQEQEGDLSM